MSTMTKRVSPILASTTGTSQDATKALKAFQSKLTAEQALQMVNEEINSALSEISRFPADQKLRVVAKLNIALPW